MQIVNANGRPMMDTSTISARGEAMTYTIEATGQGGWMSYRYQYKAGVHDYFGYTETEEEALSIIKEAGL